MHQKYIVHSECSTLLFNTQSQYGFSPIIGIMPPHGFPIVIFAWRTIAGEFKGTWKYMFKIGKIYFVALELKY